MEMERDSNVGMGGMIERWALREIAPRCAEFDRPGVDGTALRPWMQAMAESGITSLAAPESVGGAGLGSGPAATALGAIARTCAGAALLAWSHVVPTLLAARAGQALAGGPSEWLGTAHFACVRGIRRGSVWILDGPAGWAWGAGVAARVLVAFEAEKQTKLALVPVSARGLQFGALHDKLGLRACPSADLDLRGVEVPATECFTPQGGLAAARALALRLVGAIATGNGRGAIARGIAYASDRIQGGDRIIRHGIIQSLLGEAELALAAAEAWIARVPDEDGDLAKVVGTRAGEQAALDAVQVHGGYGYMRDYKVEKCLRDAKMLSLIGGDNRRLVQSNFERRVLAQVVP